jgi:ATP-binding cassette subfamily B protein
MVKDHIGSLVYAKTGEVAYGFFDSPEFYDRLYRANAESWGAPLATLEVLGALIQNGVTIVAMAGVLLRFGTWFPMALMMGTVPAVVVMVRYTIRYHAWRRRSTSDRRRIAYFNWLLVSRETAAELRLFDLASYFRSAHDILRGRLRSETLQMARAQGVAEISAGISGLAVMGLTVSFFVWKAVRGLITLGELALLQQAFQHGMRLTRSLLESASQLYTNLFFLGDLFEFLATDPAAADPAPRHSGPGELAHEICFRDVRFRYPGSSRWALDGLNLRIPAGQMVAIVGSNGAGKTTLVRLLCRFYDPEGGAIEWDGVNLRSFAVSELRRRISVLFQDPVHYSATVAENIAYGDRDAGSDRIAAAARDAGAETIVNGLPGRYDQALGKWFTDGVELSGGEWHRIALARTCVRRSPLLVLDEPTSSMDPWTEVDWGERLVQTFQGRTTIVITQRLSTARFANRIYVLEEGRVLESGSHEELLRKSGKYARAWALQFPTPPLEQQPRDGQPIQGTREARPQGRID